MNKPLFNYLRLAFLCCISAVTLLSSCAKVTCPAFEDENFDLWFPYSGTQTLYFENRTLKDTIRINGTYRSQQISGYTPESDCNMYAEVTADNNSQYQYTRFSIDYSKFQNQNRFTLYLNGSKFEADELTENGLKFNSPRFKTAFNPLLLLNGILHTNVQVIERDTLSSGLPGIKRIWIAKQKGLVAYEKYPSDGVWLLK